MDALLAEADWLRGLAIGLIRNRADADDLVQETWAATLRSPPEPGRPPRPWLGQVVRNVLRMDLRGSARRRTREQQAAPLITEEPADPAVLLERLELQRMIAGLVKELEEPFRTVLVLRFFEGRLPADIARAQGLNAGTIRWRIHEGLERLRLLLDREHGGRREGWRSLLLPLAGPVPTGTARGGSVSTPIAAAKLAALGLGAAGVLGLVLAQGRAPAPLQRPAPLTAEPTASTTTSEEERTMMRNTSRAVALFGVLLPALAASAEDSARLSPVETIDFCIEMREKMAACKDVVADIRSSRVPADKREGTRQMILKEITEDGTGPLEPRKAKCATDLKLPKAIWISHINKADVRAIRSCDIDKDCKMGVACWMNAIEPIVARSRKP